MSTTEIGHLQDEINFLASAYKLAAAALEQDPGNAHAELVR
jgi:hypothetical protein